MPFMTSLYGHAVEFHEKISIWHWKQRTGKRKSVETIEKGILFIFLGAESWKLFRSFLNCCCWFVVVVFGQKYQEYASRAATRASKGMWERKGISSHVMAETKHNEPNNPKKISTIIKNKKSEIPFCIEEKNTERILQGFDERSVTSSYIGMFTHGLSYDETCQLFPYVLKYHKFFSSHITHLRTKAILSVFTISKSFSCYSRSEWLMKAEHHHH